MFASKIFRNISHSFQKFFHCWEKEVVIISHGRTSGHFKVGLGKQLLFAVLVGWSIYSSVAFTQYRALTERQIGRIAAFTSSTKFLEREVNSLYSSLAKLDTYLNIANQYNHFDIAQKNTVTASINNNPELLQLANASSDNGKLNSVNYSPIAGALRDTANLLGQVYEKVLVRINGLEGVVTNSGFVFRENNIRRELTPQKEEVVKLDPAMFIVTKTDEYFVENSTLPFLKVKPINPDDSHSILNFEVINNNILYLTELENFVSVIPLSSPISEFRITSPFGQRKDPFNRTLANHHGVDLAGPLNSEIFSTSIGRVSFAGQKSGYGNVVEIDHGHGIKTLYGHLKTILASKGEIVRQGQVIGIQGSTGRSTGPHLHYEVRYKNKPYQPLNFMETGKKFDEYGFKNI